MKTRPRGSLLLAFVTALTAASAQDVRRLDPGLDKLVASNAKVDRVLTGFNKWTEGPVWTRDGRLLFAEIPANNIDIWKPADKTASVFMHPSGYAGAEPYGGPEPGSNGMTLDPDGRIAVAGHARRNVWRLESVDSKAQITVLADSYQGKKLNSPNDLVYTSDGSLYFTDPPYGLPTQGDNDPLKEQPMNGVYRIPGARRHKAGAPPENDKLQLVVKDIGRPNGIAFSPDEKYMYIAESGKKVWLRYKVQADGSVTDGTVFLDAKTDSSPGVPDGMRIDKKGNIYSSGPGGVWIMSPEGKHLGTIRVPEVVANVAWGDKDAKTLYIVASTSVYKVRTKVAGIRN